MKLLSLIKFRTNTKYLRNKMKNSIIHFSIPKLLKYDYFLKRVHLIQIVISKIRFLKIDGLTITKKEV